MIPKYLTLTIHPPKLPPTIPIKASFKAIQDKAHRVVPRKGKHARKGL